MKVLGIESSCDETSVAVISDGELKANLVASQDFHKKYGGVIPELSSRAHLQIIVPLVKDTLEKASVEAADLDVIAATAGPGLIGALLVGFTFAKGFAFALGKKFVAVNHIEGHIFSGFLMDEKPEFPFLCLVVSGGHTLLLIVKSETEIIRLGTTVDDAAGEAFDKVAKLLGLEYPGGPLIQKYAEKGNPSAINFPIAQLKNPYDFSFSGLKTAVLRYKQKRFGEKAKIPEKDLADIASAFQIAVIKALTQKIEKAVREYEVTSISVVGGVAANSALRSEVLKLGKRFGKKVVIPDIKYCGDNAAMIAYRGWTLARNGFYSPWNSSAYPSLKKGDLSFWKNRL